MQATGGLDFRVLDTVDDPMLVTNLTGEILFWNQAAVAYYGVAVEDAVGHQALGLLGREWADGERMAEASRQLAATGEWHAEVGQVKADGSHAVVHARLRAIRDGETTVGLSITMLDVTSRREIERERSLLAAAVDQAAESVVITDLDANILYVNPAFEEVSGYRRDEVLGRNPRILKTGRQTAAFYRAMWDRLLAGGTFRGEFENQRKDGSTYHEVATITPVLGPDGTPQHYLAVKRDVTRQRALERRIDREARERAAAMDGLAAVRPGTTAELTAASIATVLVDRCGFDQVVLVSFEADDQAVTLAAAGNDSAPLPRLLSEAVSRALVDRATAGPWIEAAGPGIDRQRQLLSGQALVHAPILFGGEVVGLIAVSVPGDALDAAVQRLDLLVEVAAMSAGLMGAALAARRATASTRLAIQHVIDERAFHPVFQPLTDLETGTILGFEALTRFHDDTPPDVMFATAERCGIGLELEERTIEAALEAAGTLPANGRLHINVSPALLLEETRLRRLLGQLGWNVTLEVTEHHPIADYDAIRASLERIGPTVELAVDDAGAGFASLRHILELRPMGVKLDRFLVMGIDSDPTRQALVAGMVHFAASTGFTLVAEGIETEAERETLIRMGVTRGQGFLLGRPALPPAPLEHPAAPPVTVLPTRRPGRGRASEPARHPVLPTAR